MSVSKKMTGSPFHIESAAYKYHMEKSEVPIADSEFNKALKECRNCAYYCDVDDRKKCLNTKLAKNKNYDHCVGYRNDKEVPNLVGLREELIKEYKSYRTRNVIQYLCYLIKTRKIIPSMLKPYVNKRWVIMGVNNKYDKHDIQKLIYFLGGQLWNMYDDPWDYHYCDIALNLGGNPFRLKEIRKYQKENENTIMQIDELYALCVKGVLWFKEKKMTQRSRKT